MGKRKSTQTNNYQYMTPPTTANQQAYVNAGKDIDLKSGIMSNYGRLEKQVNDGIYDDKGLPDAFRGNVKYSRMFDLLQNKGQDLSNATANEKQMSLGHLANVANIGNPQLVNVSSRGTNSGSFLDTMQQGLGIAGMA